MAQPESRFFERVAELLEDDAPFMVCRVTHAVGSAPRNPGARMLVFPDGRSEFTLGGGAIEGRVIREAVLSFDERPTAVREYHLGDLGMHCGGIMRVAFERARGEDLPFYRAAARFVHERIPFIEAYALAAAPEGPWPKALFPQDRAPLGDPALVARVRAQAEALWGQEAQRLETETLFLHKVWPPLRLLIFGAGHVGAKLAEVAAATGLFSIEVVDDRPEFADPAKLPGAERVQVAPPDYERPLPLPDARTFVAVITRCHATDKRVVQTLLESQRPFAYLGMIGSVPKRAKLFRFLREAGVPAEALEQVVTPMGLPIGGKEPGEIAVSMLAEMIQRKNALEGTLEGGIIRWKRRQAQLKT